MKRHRMPKRPSIDETASQTSMPTPMPTPLKPHKQLSLIDESSEDVGVAHSANTLASVSRSRELNAETIDSDDWKAIARELQALRRDILVIEDNIVQRLITRLNLNAAEEVFSDDGK